MIQTWLQIKDSTESLKVNQDDFVQIQKIFSTSRYICFNMRFPGQTRYIYLGRGSNYEGLWEGSRPPISDLRIRDRLLEYLRKHLSSSTLLAIKVDERDRLITIEYQKWGHKNYFCLFYSGRKSYFSNCYFDPKRKEMAMYCSWQRLAPDDYQANLHNPQVFFNSVGFRANQMDLTKTKKSVSIEKLLEDEIDSCTLVDNKKHKKLSRKIVKIEGDLEREWVPIL